MNNTRFTLTFYGGVWLILFAVFLLTPGWSLGSIILGAVLFLLCPTWQHFFEFMLEKKLFKERMKENIREHAENLKRDGK